MREPQSRALDSDEKDLEPLMSGLDELRVEMHSIQDCLARILQVVEYREVKKDSYTTTEVAQILNKRPYTVREWCRLSRVRADKTFSGRGIDEEWRISHAELQRIKNEGLLPIASRFGRELEKTAD